MLHRICSVLLDNNELFYLSGLVLFPSFSLHPTSGGWLPTKGSLGSLLYGKSVLRLLLFLFEDIWVKFNWIVNRFIFLSLKCHKIVENVLYDSLEHEVAKIFSWPSYMTKRKPQHSLILRSWIHKYLTFFALKLTKTLTN